MDENKLERIQELLKNPTIQSNVNIGNTGICLGLTISQNIAIRLGPNNSKGIQVAETRVSEGTKFAFQIQDLSYGDEATKLFPDINPELKLSKELQKAISSRLDERLLSNLITSEMKKATKIKQFKEMWPDQFEHMEESETIRKESQQQFLNYEMDEFLDNKQEDLDINTQENVNFGLEKLNLWTNIKKVDLEAKEQQKSKSILIVDDDCFNLNVLEALLKRLKYQCVKAANGQEAINKLIENQINSDHSNELLNTQDNQNFISNSGFQLIIMDYQMPILDGVEATKIIKKMIENGEIQEVPIIACTAFGAKDDYENLLNAGMKDVLLKPVDIGKLQTMINKLIK